MSNLLFGILTFLLCGLGYYFSWRYWAKDNYKIAVLLLIVCGLALRIYTSTEFFLHTWDERYHALVAKNMLEHPLMPTLYDNPILPYDYKSWTTNHVWVHKQPLPLWTMAGSMWLFGVNEIGLRLPSILLTTIGIWLTFYIGYYLINKKVGYLAAFFYSINGLIIEMTGGRVATDHFDIFFLFFVQLSIFFSIVFAQKKKPIYNILTGISLGAAILSKWMPALVVLPIWILIVIDSGNFKSREIVFHFVVLITTCILIFLPWQLYIFSAFPLEAEWEATFNFKHITEVLDEQGGRFYYFADKIRINYNDMIYLPLVWFLWKTAKNLTQFKYLLITIWFLIPFLFFSLVKTKMQAYILFISPALFLMTAAFWVMLSEYKINSKPKWFYNLILILLIAFPIRYAIERIKPFETSERNLPWVTDLKKLNEKQIANGVLLNYNRPIEAMFYTGFTVYPNIPDSAVIIDLIEKKYQVCINDDGKIPEEIKSIKGVVITHLIAARD